MKKNCCYSEGNVAEWYDANVLPKVTRQVRKKYKINLCLGRKYSEFEKICSKGEVSFFFLFQDKIKIADRLYT